MLIATDVLPELLPPRGYVRPAELSAGIAPAGAAALVDAAIDRALAGDAAEAVPLLDRASANGGDAAAQLLVHVNRAQLLIDIGELRESGHAAASALRLARREKRDEWIALAGLASALAHLARGRRNDARTRLAESVRTFARVGDAVRQIQCHYLLGEVAYLGEDPIRAGAHYRDALGVARAVAAQEWIELLTLRFEHR